METEKAVSSSYRTQNRKHDQKLTFIKGDVFILSLRVQKRMPYLGLICSLFRTKLNKRTKKLPTLTIQFIKAVCAWMRKKNAKFFQNRINTSTFKLSRFTHTESNLLEMFSFLLEIESMSLCRQVLGFPSYCSSQRRPGSRACLGGRASCQLFT